MAKLFGEETRTPSIPDLRTAKPEQILAALKEWVEVRQGARGDGLDRALTMRDVLNAGIATPGSIAGLFPGNGPTPIPLLPGVVSGPIPPTPTNLVAAGAVSTILLSWDFARGYERLAEFEVWRADTDALGSAVQIASTYSPLYSDDVGPGAKFYYWVRAVSDAGKSPFNAVSGTLGETAINVQEVIDAVTGEINDSGLLDQLTVKVNNQGLVSGYGLASTPSNSATSTTFAVLANRFAIGAPAGIGVPTTVPFFVQTTATTVNGVYVPVGVYMTDAFIMNGVITSAKIGNLAVDDAKISSMSAAKITAGQLGIGSYIESTGYLSGQSGFRIHGNGNSEFANTTVRGTVYATAGSVGGVLIANQGLQSQNYNGTRGWRITADGDVLFNNGIFRGDITGATGSFSGSLNAATGSFRGDISAATGTFTGNIKGGQFTVGAFTDWGWPASWANGGYFGPEGIKLGSFPANRWFEVTAYGNVSAPGLSIVDGRMTISAINVIDTLQINGNAVSSTAYSNGTGTVFLYSPAPAAVIVFIKAYGVAEWTRGQYAVCQVNGGEVTRSNTMVFATSSAGGDNDPNIYTADSSMGMAIANVGGGNTSISFGAVGGGTLNAYIVAFILKR